MDTEHHHKVDTYCKHLYCIRWISLYGRHLSKMDTFIWQTPLYCGQRCVCKVNTDIRQTKLFLHHRNLKTEWKPRRKKSPSFQEDPEYAKRVEAIISSTVPGSTEEMEMIMKATKSPVQHSPKKGLTSSWSRKQNELNRSVLLHIAKIRPVSQRILD